MKILIAIIALLCLNTALAYQTIPYVIPELDDYITNMVATDTTHTANITAINRTTEGLNKQLRARVDFDVTVDGGTVATYGTGVTLPDNSVIERCWYDVITTFVSESGDSATIAINIPTDGDLQAATAISAGGNVYDAGLHECATKGNDYSDPSTFLKTTAAREVSIVVASDTATAGKMIIFLDYSITE